MAAIDYDIELRRAGAHATAGWRRVPFLAQRHVLGAIGLVIMMLFVLTAILGRFHRALRSADVDSAIALARPAWRTGWARIPSAAMSSAASSTARASRSPSASARPRSAASIGVIVGLTSGYLSGWVDLVFQRVSDILQALPLLVLALIMTAALGPSLPNVIIAIAIPLIPTVSRVIRANTLALRELPFIEAAKSIGMSEVRIALRHVLPNTLAPLIVLATAQLGSTILTEASLSFLGLGIPEPYPSWGRMLSESAAEYVRTAPWLVIFPGIAISLAVFGANLFGDALRDILDPRQRG